MEKVEKGKREKRKLEKGKREKGKGKRVFFLKQNDAMNSIFQFTLVAVFPFFVSITKKQQMSAK